MFTVLYVTCNATHHKALLQSTRMFASRDCYTKHSCIYGMKISTTSVSDLNLIYDKQ